MKFYRYLYVSESLEKKQEKLIKKLEQGKLHKSVQLIVLASNVENHLDIFSSIQLLQPVFSKEEMFVVGITKDFEEALEFVEHLVEKVYNETGRIDLRSYILEKEQEI